MKTISLEQLQDLKLIEKNDSLKEKPGQDRCLICNKPMNITDKTKYVHLLTDGNLTVKEEDNNSQGFFPVGMDCKKKIEKEYLF